MNRKGWILALLVTSIFTPGMIQALELGRTLDEQLSRCSSHWRDVVPFEQIGAGGSIDTSQRDLLLALQNIKQDGHAITKSAYEYLTTEAVACASYSSGSVLGMPGFTKTNHLEFWQDFCAEIFDIEALINFHSGRDDILTAEQKFEVRVLMARFDITETLFVPISVGLHKKAVYCTKFAEGFIRTRRAHEPPITIPYSESAVEH